MVKGLLVTSAVALLISGCATSNEVVKVERLTYVQDSVSSKVLSEEERSLLYRGDYDINYKPPRVVWFKPLLTARGNVLSERTLTLAPKDLRWTDEHNMNVGDKFKELINGDRK